MKILDRYILTTFLKTFFSVFFILVFIFILQSIWLFIKDLAGKDLEFVIFGKFLIYVFPTLIPLILPLTILLTSIMIFGNFSENYEFAAMKSSGISLHRAMRSLTIFIGILSIVTFFFANNVIPWGQYEFNNLRRNIAQITPAAAIVEGQFNPIGDFNIKVDEKYGDDDRLLKNVVLHQKKGGENTTVIKAKKGELISSEGSNILQLVLYNGNYYHDITPKDYKKKRKLPHAKSSFGKYTMNIDLTELDKSDKKNKGKSNVSYKMLKINQLIPTIDSLEQKVSSDVKADNDNLYNTLALSTNNVIKVKKTIKDSISGKKKTIKTYTKNKKKNDSIFYEGDILDLFTDLKEQEKIYDLAISNSITAYRKIETRETNLDKGLSNLNRHKVAIHKKFALAFSCFILFFVGAPLGAIIRKGGMGLPMVIAIILFLSYWFIGIFAENSSEKGGIPPFLGGWMSTLIMLPLGIIFTRNATSDKGMFNTDGIYQFFSNLLAKYTKQKTNTKVSHIKIIEQHESITVSESSKKQLNKVYTEFKKHTSSAFELFVILIVNIVITLFSEINIYILSTIAILILAYIFFLVKSFLTYKELYKILKETISLTSPINFLVLGTLLNPFNFFISKKKIDEAMKQIR